MFIRQNLRIYPNKEQEKFFMQDIGNQRFIWNHILGKSIDKYKQEKKFIWYHEAAGLLPELKKELEWLKLGNSQALQQTLKDLDQAFKMAFKKTGKKSGFPKFKKKQNGGSVRYPASVNLIDKKLFVPKLKSGIKVRGENLSTEFKSVTICLRPSGKWFASFVVEIPDVQKVQISANSTAVGIDLNSRHIMALDDGSAVVNPKHLLEKEKRLKRYQKAFSRKQNGSANKNKARIKLAKIHEKVANCRKDFVEKLTTYIVKNNDIIVIEDLNVKAMQKWNGRMIQSAPFGIIRSKLTWKTNKLGKHLVVIDRFETDK
jgi:putative transposase